MAQKESPKKESENETSINSGVKRYNLVIPAPLFNEVQHMAEKEHTTMLELFKRCIKIGLVILRLSPGAEVIIRQDGGETKLIWI
jgi:hypothetical protein